jgi:AcrR family transcriptional regulator
VRRRPAAARPARDREATRARLLAAVGIVLARDGFARLGVNAVAAEAGVDKVLIYRYFGGMPELVREWGASGEFWPRVSDFVASRPAAFLDAPVAEQLADFFDDFIDGLRRRPLTIEILAAEIVERTELTAILESEREQWGAEVAELLGGKAAAGHAELKPIVLLLLAGVQYLLVRSRKIRIFGEVDLRTDAAWNEFKTAIRGLARTLLGTRRTSRRQREATGRARTMTRAIGIKGSRP